MINLDRLDHCLPLYLFIVIINCPGNNVELSYWIIPSAKDPSMLPSLHSQQCNHQTVQDDKMTETLYDGWEATSDWMW